MYSAPLLIFTLTTGNIKALLIYQSEARQLSQQLFDAHLLTKMAAFLLAEIPINKTWNLID